MARLYAKCTVPVNHIKGRLGWSIFYQDTNEVDYDRSSTINLKNTSSASLTVYNDSSEIPGSANNKNLTTSSSYISVSSSNAYSNNTQFNLCYLSNTGLPVDPIRLDNLYNVCINQSVSLSLNDSLTYVNGESSVINTNHSRAFNRNIYVSANNSRKFAVGNDSAISGVCFFERSGLFPAGIYKLDVQRFSEFGNTPLKTNTMIWKIKVPQDTLSCGTYNDVYKPINLV